MQRRVMYREAAPKPPQRVWVRVPNAKMGTFKLRLVTCPHLPQYKVSIQADGPEHIITYNRKDSDIIHEIVKDLAIYVRQH